MSQRATVAGGRDELLETTLCGSQPTAFDLALLDVMTARWDNDGVLQVWAELLA